MSLRSDAIRALARARATPSSQVADSGISHAVRVGDATAIYAAPFELGELAPQATLGAGSVISDILNNNAQLADADALAVALRGDGGVRDLWVSLWIEPQGGPLLGKRYRERIKVQVTLKGDGKQDALMVARAIMKEARRRFYDRRGESSLVKLAEALLVPEGAAIGLEEGQEILPDPAPQPLTRAMRARGQLRDRRGRFVSQNPRKRPAMVWSVAADAVVPEVRERALRALARRQARERAKRSLAAKLGAVTRRARAEGKNPVKAKAGYLGALAKAKAKKAKAKKAKAKKGPGSTTRTRAS